MVWELDSAHLGDPIKLVNYSCHAAQRVHCIAGLWTIGNGEIECPPAEDMFFLPQQPFMPLGTLRQQLLFPSGAGHGHLQSFAFIVPAC